MLVEVFAIAGFLYGVAGFVSSGIMAYYQQKSDDKNEILKEILYEFCKRYDENYNKILGEVDGFSIDIIKSNLSEIENINAQNEDRYTLLHYALNNGYSAEVIKLLVAEGSDVNKAQINGITPLYFALSFNFDYEVIEFLLESGAKVNVVTNDGETALHCAVIEMNSAEIIDLLISKGANPYIEKKHCRLNSFELLEKFKPVTGDKYYNEIKEILEKAPMPQDDTLVVNTEETEDSSKKEEKVEEVEEEEQNDQPNISKESFDEQGGALGELKPAEKEEVVGDDIQ